MKQWYCFLELLIVLEVIAWICFFPDGFEYDFVKGMIGLVSLCAIEKCKDIDRSE